jgi:hypothetical protein
MRADAKNLLEQLGASGLAYHEFPDRFAEFEYWPLLVAVLADPVVRERIERADTQVPAGTLDARAMQQQLAALRDAGTI